MLGNRHKCRIIRRCCLVVVVTILLPFILIILIATSNQNRFKTFDFYKNETNYETTSLEQQPEVMSQNEFENIEARMIQRNLYLAEKCSYFGLDIPGNDSLHRPNPWEFLVNKKHHLIWCNIFKAASSSWMHNFNYLAGYSEDVLKNPRNIAIQLARTKYPRPTWQELQEAMNTSITFFIVRHPFERLLSGYKDKIQYALPHTYHQQLSQTIIRKYRKKTNNKPTTRWPSFSEFVNYLLDEVKHNKTLDMHWAPMTTFCTPCQIKFNIIIKFETFDEDQKYLIERVKLKHIIKPQWKNLGKGKNTSDILMKAFSELTRKQIERLYEIYKYDFELFNYSPKQYFDIALKESIDNVKIV